MQIVIFEVPAQMLSKFQIYSFCCSGNNTSNFAPTVITNCNIKVGKHTKHVQDKKFRMALYNYWFLQYVRVQKCPSSLPSSPIKSFTGSWQSPTSSQLFTLPQFWSFSCFTMIYDDLQCFTMVYNVSQWFTMIYNVDLEMFENLQFCHKLSDSSWWPQSRTMYSGLGIQYFHNWSSSNNNHMRLFFCSKLDGCSSFTKYWPFDHNLFHLTFYCQDTLAILGGYIGAVNVPEKW